MRTYCIIDASEVSSIDFTQVLQTSVNSLKYSLDGSQVLLKYEGDTPSFLEGKTQYSHSEIKVILEGDEWTDPNLPGE